MQQNLPKYGKCCMQYYQLPNKTPLESKAKLPHNFFLSQWRSIWLNNILHAVVLRCGCFLQLVECEYFWRCYDLPGVESQLADGLVLAPCNSKQTQGRSTAIHVDPLSNQIQLVEFCSWLTEWISKDDQYAKTLDWSCHRLQFAYEGQSIILLLLMYSCDSNNVSLCNGQLSEPFEVFTFELYKSPDDHGRREHKVPITRQGRGHALITWYI